MAYDNTNTGAIFRNDKKVEEKQPDYNGTLNVAGVTYWISGWIKTAGPMAKNPGQKFMSLAVTPQQKTQSSPVPGSADYDPDIPF